MTPFFRVIGISTMVCSTLAACRSKEERNSPTADSARNDTAAGMPAMPGMAGGQMGNMTAAMMDSMQTHMAMMDTVSADHMKAMLPTHRQMVANMLSSMNSEMRQMNMSPDAAWAATIDSVRQDLTTMPDMTGPQLKAMMAAHHARVMRLVEQHRAMMRNPR